MGNGCVVRNILLGTLGKEFPLLDWKMEVGDLDNACYVDYIGSSRLSNLAITIRNFYQEDEGILTEYLLNEGSGWDLLDIPGEDVGYPLSRLLVEKTREQVRVRLKEITASRWIPINKLWSFPASIILCHDIEYFLIYLMRGRKVSEEEGYREGWYLTSERELPIVGAYLPPCRIDSEEFISWLSEQYKLHIGEDDDN